jgi:cathepsin L
MKLLGLSVAAALGLLAHTDAALVRGSSGKDQPQQASRLSLDLEPHHHYTFERYVQEFGKDYVRGSEEWAERKALFLERLRDIQAHNSAHTQGTGKTYRKGVNEYADWTEAELRGMLGFKPSGEWHRKRQPGLEAMSALMEGAGNESQLTEFRQQERLLTNLPTHVDWREKGAVTKPKNQGACGS